MVFYDFFSRLMFSQMFSAETRFLIHFLAQFRNAPTVAHQCKIHQRHCVVSMIKTLCSGLNEIYVWFLLPTYPIFFNPTLNIKMGFEEKIPKMGTFSDFVTIFFVKCYNKI